MNEQHEPEPVQQPEPDANQSASAQQHPKVDSTTTPSANPVPGPVKFFDWLRNLGFTREPGWLGGIAAGIALRINIDVALVRGILVILGVLGLPVLFIYGVAWLLLPDSTGKIHLEELIRGNAEPPLIGIGIMILLGLSAFGRGIWPAFHGFNFSFFGGFWPTLWSLLLIGGIITAVYFMSRSMWWQDSMKSSADFVGYPDATPYATATPTMNFAQPSQKAPTPPPPPRNASPDQMAAWRQQQQAWRSEHAAWKAAQNQSREEWRAAQRLQHQEQRRIRMAEQRLRAEEYQARNPRLSGAFILIVLGLAMIIGTIAGVAVIDYQVEVGITTGALVLGLAMIVAALVGRRTALLGWLSAIALFNVMVWSTFSGFGNYLNIGTNVMTPWSAQAEEYNLPVGALRINLDDVESYLETRPIERNLSVDHGIGQTRIYIPVDSNVTVHAEVGIGSISVHNLTDGTRQWGSASSGLTSGQSTSGFGREVTFSTGNARNPEFTVQVDLGIGSVVIIPVEDAPPTNNRSLNELQEGALTW